MNDERPILIVGGEGSPYSCKMRAVLRYRRIPYRWVVRGSQEAEHLPKPPVDLIPVLIFPDEPESAQIDSTPLIRRLEGMVDDRSVIPTDPAVAFLDAVIEDWADEWLTKQMFHYRWSFDDAVRKAARVLPFQHFPNLEGKDYEQISQGFSRRQVKRLEVVGCSPTTAPVIEDSYVRTLRLLDAHLAERPFLMGRRPGSSDFGVYGQLSQLVLFDPPSIELAVAEAPRVIAWVQQTDDLSWLEVDAEGWLSRDGAGGLLRPVLEEIGRVYVPFLLANSSAVKQRLDRVECEIDGRPWVQQPFKYQAKCLRWLRDGHAALAEDDRSWVDDILAGTGCDALFA
jgi:glutathione S-transferase